MQACASISVSKLCNFHLPSLVTFVNKLFFCFVLKYLRLPVLKTYFVKKKFSFCPKVSLFFCYLTLTMSHSYTNNKWKFIAVDMVNIFHLQPYSPLSLSWGMGNLHFPGNFCLPNFGLKCSDYEQKPKLVFVETE